ncbi:hypothetical protein KR054_007015, partial [Drosophila jambulina]
RFEFTNLFCNSLDKKFVEFEYCHIKAINRTYKYVSGKLKVYKMPLTKLMVNVGLWKRFNGYKPFLYNITLEVCSFLRNPKSNPVAKFLYDIQRSYSNMNHSCPLNHDVILDKLPVDFINDQITRVLPFPEGDYLVKIHWLISQYPAALAEIYGTLS